MAPKQTDPQFKLRLTPALKSQLDAAAIENNRSVNAEILHRLSESFSIKNDVAKVAAELTKLKSRMSLLHAESIYLPDEEPILIREAIAVNGILEWLVESDSIRDVGIRDIVRSAFATPAGAERTQDLEQLLKVIYTRREVDRSFARATEALEALRARLPTKKQRRSAPPEN